MESGPLVTETGLDLSRGRPSNLWADGEEFGESEKCKGKMGGGGPSYNSSVAQ